MIPGKQITYVAGEDLSSHQYRFVKLNTSGLLVASGDGEVAVGVLQNAPESGQDATVMIDGVSKVVLGGNVTAGDNIGSDALGEAVTAAASDPIIGVAEVSGSDGETISILLVNKQSVGLAGTGYMDIAIPVALADLDNNEILTDLILGFAGEIFKVYFVTEDPTTDTTGHSAVITVEIETTATTGGVLTISDDVTAGDPDTRGKVVYATAITAANTFDDDEKISVVVADGTAFSDGAGVVHVIVRY